MGNEPSADALDLILVLLLTLGSGVIYVSGAVPLRAIAENTVIGRQMVDIIRSTGRQSITWRIARDQRALTLIKEHPVLGSGQWDWWRKNNERPWDLALLIFGQFGLIGLMLAFGSLLLPILRAFNNQRNSYTWRRAHPAAPLGVIVLMAIADALFNSFIFYPGLLAAGALVAGHGERQHLARS